MGKNIFGFLAIIIMISIVNYLNEKDKRDIIASKNGSRSDTFDYLELTKSLQVDFPNKLFRLKGYPEIFSFSELISYKTYQNSNTITSGLRGASVNVGLGVSLGGTSKTTSLEEVENLDIVIKTSGRNEGRYTYKYILSNALKANSDKYRILLEDAEDSEEILNQIMNKR